MPKIAKKVSLNKAGEKVTRYTFRYQDLSGTRKFASFALKRDAEAALDRITQELKTGVHVAKVDEATVKEVCALFETAAELQVRDGRIGRSSMKWKREVIKNHIAPGLGAVSFNKLTYLQVERWHRGLVEKGLATYSAKSYLRLLKQIEDFARKRKLTSKAIALEVMGDLKNAAPVKISVFTKGQVDRLLAAASGGRAPYQTEHAYSVTRCAVHLAAVCGLRFGEVMGLTLDCVDLNRRVLRVRHNLTQFQEHKGPKTIAGRRDFPMPRVIADMLAHHIRFFYLPNESGFIFRSAACTAIAAGNFHRSYWRPLLRKAGLLEGIRGRTFHFHALRHFCASLMIEHGISMPEIARLLGHSKFDTTLQVYAHSIVDEAQRPDLIEGMASRLSLAAVVLPPSIDIERAPT